jgi:hypothetical protein
METPHNQSMTTSASVLHGEHFTGRLAKWLMPGSKQIN